MSIVPVEIRPHLIPFFFQEFDGEKASYRGKEVTAVKISTKSSLGRMMRLFMVKIAKPVKTDYYNLYLSVADTPSGKEYEGTFYRYESGSKSFLEMPKDVSREINGLLEDIFRIAFLYFVSGYMYEGKSNITKGIDAWIEKYDLLEFGFSNSSLRQLYYRERNKGKLNRLQQPSANRVLNYL